MPGPRAHRLRPEPLADLGGEPSNYAGIIRRLAPADDPAHIEAWLLQVHGTLDAIEPIRFARATKAAADRARVTSRGDNDALARSFGLRVTG
jgi:hypothetical protein